MALISSECLWFMTCSRGHELNQMYISRLLQVYFQASEFNKGCVATRHNAFYYYQNRIKLYIMHKKQLSQLISQNHHHNVWYFVFSSEHHVRKPVMTTKKSATYVNQIARYGISNMHAHSVFLKTCKNKSAKGFFHFLV